MMLMDVSQLKKEMTVKGIMLDFDHTLARLDDPGYGGLFQIFTQRGVLFELVKASYEEVKAKSGFSIENLREVVAKKVNFPFERKTIEREFEAWLRQHFLPYPDAIGAVMKWRQEHIPILIVTAGEDAYQRKKIEAASIPVDRIITIPRANEKAATVRQLIVEYGTPLAVFDDKASELDSLREHGIRENEVFTVWVHRSDSPYFNQVPRYRHQEVKNLTEKTLAELFGVTVP